MYIDSRRVVYTVPTANFATIRSNCIKVACFDKSLIHNHKLRCKVLRGLKKMVDEKMEMNDTETFASLPPNDPKNVHELTQYVQSLLDCIQSKFQNMSDQILSRIDEMGNRIDDLEKNIGDLMTQAGVEGSEK